VAEAGAAARRPAWWSGWRGAGGYRYDSGHIASASRGRRRPPWTRTRTMKFREGLRGWLEKTPVRGEPLALNVSGT